MRTFFAFLIVSFSIVFNQLLISAIFYFLWPLVSGKYFGFLPDVYLSPPFWDIVIVFIIIDVLRTVVVGSKTNSIKIDWKK